MKLTRTQRFILYSLSKFYEHLNQPLEDKPLKLRTSKVAFIELLTKSKIIARQERALYKNLEILEKKKLIEYDNRMIRFTKIGLTITARICAEVEMFGKIEEYFKSASTKRKLQTTID